MDPDHRSDFVIGMTLAEVFLLLLFVVWLSTAIEVSPDGNPDAPIDAVALKVTVTELRERIASLETDKQELSARVEALRDMLGAPNESLEGFREGFKRKLDEAKRGSPVCLPANILVHVARTDGVDIVRLLRDTRGLLPGGKWSEGAQLHDENEIQEFLRAVKNYYAKAEKKCRFDYKLTYKSDSDYRLGRTRYESEAFYNAGLQHAR